MTVAQEIASRIAAVRQKAGAMVANELDDIIGGLLINGVREDEIELQCYPDCRWTIVVRGVPRYNVRFKFNCTSEG